VKGWHARHNLHTTVSSSFAARLPAELHRLSSTGSKPLRAAGSQEPLRVNDQRNQPKVRKMCVGAFSNSTARRRRYT